MKYRILVALMVLLLFLPLSCTQPVKQEPPQNWTVANEAEFLAKCEHCNISFEQCVINDTTIYYYQRMIGNATVEFDRISYQFYKNGTLERKIVHWRYDLLDKLPKVITKEEALTIGGGTKAYLVYIDPESTVFASVTPVPIDPCWAVSVYDSEGWNIDVVVVDAVTGKILGHGVPVP